MNLSNRLTFSLVFSVLLVAVFAFVPSVMAAEGGPTATITIDDSPISAVGDVAAIPTVDGTNVLLTNSDRNALVTSGNGFFRVIVSFSEQVFLTADETDVDTADVFVPGITLGDGNTEIWSYIAGSVETGLQLTEGIEITNIARVNTAADDAPEVLSKTQYRVTLQVASANTPLVLTLTLNEDRVYGVGTAFQIGNPPQPAVPGIANQEASGTFTVIPKVLLKPDVLVSASKIGLDESVTITLSFDDAPTGDDRPTRTNIKVTNGSIKPNDPDTDGDDGLFANEDGKFWTLVIIPQGGIGNFYKMKVEGMPGAPFVLVEVITVDSTPLSQQIDLDGPANDTGPKGGGEFTVTITYTVAPSSDLTPEGVTVTGGAKGTFNKVSDTVYNIVIDPTDPDAGVTGTLTVAVGQYSQIFSIPGTDVITVTGPTTGVTSRIVSGAIMVPKNSFVVVVRDAEVVPEGQVFRAGVVKRSWSGMPNLQEIFDRSAPGGGGAIVVEDAATPANIAVGRVGISEIMWAIDYGHFGLVGQNVSQWIELHNISNKDASVKLHSLTGRDITDDSKIIGNLEAPTVDVVTNFFNNRPGSVAWDVPGSNGSTVSGVSFVSMARILPDKKDAYADSDKARFSNRDGRAAGHWTASTSSYIRKAVTVGDAQVAYEYKGTPGQVNSFKPVTQPNLKNARTNVPSNGIVINEVGNRSEADKAYEWIELRNASGGEINLRNYRISKVINNINDQALIDFPTNDNAKIGAGKVLLLVASDPAEDQEHPLAVGYNVDKKAEEQAPGLADNPVRYKVISFKNDGIPDDGNVVLIVRRPDNLENKTEDKKGPAELGTKDLDKIVDIAGYHSNLVKSSYSNPVSSTKLWPLHSFGAPDIDRNKFAVNTVHRRQHNTTNDGRSGVGTSHKDKKDNQIAFRNAGFTGVGYKRRITGGAAYEGTPGYDNGVLKSAGGDVTGSVYISEVMYADNKAGALPQWIELYNPSKTVGANLHNWRLTIVNHDLTDDEGGLWEGKGEATVLLRNMKIDPNSTILITSRKGPRSEVHMPNTDIFTLFPVRRAAFGMTSINDDVINTYGFRILLQANAHDEKKTHEWQFVDEIGNLAVATTDRRGNRERFDAVRWAWPNAINADGERSSIARTTYGGVGDGSMASSWILSDGDGRTNKIDFVYYGKNTDFSTPGQTVGQPLPVSLSYFRPTLENGEVVIRWTTQSELDNAGFNILRSDSRNGEFKQVNSELVQGAGTTGERNTYKWVDESAKPGVIYYYQIEDVSFAGERQTLTTTKLKGLISANNKLTTLWGGLKSQQD